VVPVDVTEPLFPDEAVRTGAAVEPSARSGGETAEHAPALAAGELRWNPAPGAADASAWSAGREGDAVASCGDRAHDSAN
jgi:hypothetical protein